MDAREARRRKILSRGSDRLAFITGQSQSLSQSDPPSLSLSDVGSQSDEGNSSVSSENRAKEAISSSEDEGKIQKEGPVCRGEMRHETLLQEIRNNSNISSPMFKEISKSISGSEKMRMMCSVMIALFVVMSGFSLSHKFKPLVLVVITDATIILARVLRMFPSRSGTLLHAGHAIQGALLLWELTDAFSMDCSLCALIMICAFPLFSS